MLEEVEGINLFSYKLNKYLFIILFVLYILFLIMCFNLELADRIANIFLFLGLNVFSVAIILTINFFPQYNKDFKEIKDIGEKVKAYIVDTGFTCHGRVHFRYFYITVLYNKKIKKVYGIKYNKAYKILKILLDSQQYPIINSVKIPIDINVKKNKIYADLESVDLSKIDGYEEARKVVEST